jgi:putative FmdB family regulatory protein
MPIYEYQCTSCKNNFEVVRTFTDETIEKCPKCGKKARKTISAPKIIFKGKGFYSTDNRPPDSTKKPDK